MKKIPIIIIIAFLQFTGCKKFVSIPPPKNQIVSSSVFQNASTLNSAELSVFFQMSTSPGWSAPLSLNLGMSADEFRNFTTTGDPVLLYQNNLNAQNGSVSTIWNNAYNCIFQINSILEGIDNASAIPESVRGQIKGEMKFARAFLYSYLIQLFSDVPYITSSDFNVNKTAARNSVTDILSKITADLTDAKSLLSDQFLGFDAISSSAEHLRPTKAAASALLSRIYLLAGKWDNAVTEAGIVINSGKFKLEQDLNAVFLKNSNEAILQCDNSPGNPYESYYFSFETTPSFVSLSKSLITSFDTSDLRFKNWISPVVTSSDTFYKPYKYKTFYTDNPVTEYTMFIRYAEVFLNQAEAFTRGGHLPEAIADINAIRARAGLAVYNGGVDLPSLINEILLQRRLEFFSEFGHRWLDLKRMGAVDSIMHLAEGEKGMTWRSFQQLYPIPQSERSNDPMLTQNDGY